MFEIEEDSIRVSFQWVLGDTHPLEKSIQAATRAKHRYLITILGRLAAYGLTLLVVRLLLPEADWISAILIAIVGSLSVWVSWALSIASLRTLERLMAKDARYVNFINVTVDRRGIFWSDEITQDYISWQGIKEIDASNKAIWFKTGNITGYLMPPRLFQNENERREILEKLAHFKKNALLPIHTHGLEQENQAIMH